MQELAIIAAQEREAGRKVVLAHGVFDLLHMGHVRHLEAARREGSALFVTVTADRFVNKGPGRPVFPEHLRAEMLASLEYVDWTGVNPSGTAESLLDAIRPDVYIKGNDYSNAEDDVTGKILREQEIVERHGGKLVFTDEITYSSSNLINSHLNLLEPSLKQYLDDLNDSGGLERALELMEAVRDYKVLFIGDAIIDEYQYVVPMNKSPKENMIATLFDQREVFAGGVFAAANHVASFCKQVDVLTLLGEVDSYEDLIRDSLKPNVVLEAVYKPNAPTTRKCRFIDTGYSMRKLFEVYFMDDSPAETAVGDSVQRLIKERASEYDAVIVTDFGHGLMGPDVIDAVIKNSPFLAVNAQSNSANLGYNLITRYQKSDYLCIDGPEARLAMQDKFSDLSVLAGDLLPRAIDCPNVIVTQGKHGCVTHSATHGTTRCPALTASIVDTVGAGDAFFAVTAPLVAAGATMPEAGFLGNAAGALKVGIVGHRSSVEKVPLIKFLTALLK